MVCCCFIVGVFHSDHWTRDNDRKGYQGKRIDLILLDKKWFRWIFVVDLAFVSQLWSHIWWRNCVVWLYGILITFNAIYESSNILFLRKRRAACVNLLWGEFSKNIYFYVSVKYLQTNLWQIGHFFMIVLSPWLAILGFICSLIRTVRLLPWYSFKCHHLHNE